MVFAEALGRQERVVVTVVTAFLVTVTGEGVTAAVVTRITGQAVYVFVPVVHARVEVACAMDVVDVTEKVVVVAMSTLGMKNLYKMVTLYSQVVLVV